MTQPTIAQLRNLTDRAGAGLTADEQQRLRDGINQLAALRQVARGYCPDCGRGDAAPTVTDWEQQRQRADEAERRLRNIANGHPRAESIQAEIGEMIAQTHELRDQLRATEAVVGRVRAALASFDGRGVLAIGHVNLDVPTAGEVLTAVRAALNGEQPGPA